MTINVVNRRIIYTPPSGLGLQTGLGAFWSMENTSWPDDTGNGNTLSVATGTPTVAPGKVGNAFNADGSSALTAAASSSLNTYPGSFSVQAWMNPSALPGVDFYAFISKAIPSFPHSEWGIGKQFTSANVFSFSVQYGTGTDFTASGTTAIPLNNSWYHVVGTFNATTNAVLLYVNGSLDGSATFNPSGSTSNPTAPVRVGCDAAQTGFFTGLMDQVGFWNGRVLSPTDIVNLYNGGVGLSYAGMA